MKVKCNKTFRTATAKYVAGVEYDISKETYNQMPKAFEVVKESKPIKEIKEEVPNGNS